MTDNEFKDFNWGPDDNTDKEKTQITVEESNFNNIIKDNNLEGAVREVIESKKSSVFDLMDEKIESEFEQIPYGNYSVEIVKVELGKESSKTPGLFSTVIEVVIVDGEEAKKHVWLYFLTDGSTYTENSKPVKDGKAKVGEPNLPLMGINKRHLQDIFVSFGIPIKKGTDLEFEINEKMIDLLGTLEIKENSYNKEWPIQILRK